MEGYEVPVKQSLSYSMKSIETSKKVGICENGSSSRKRGRNQVNGWREREQREKLNEKFYHLQSLLPSLKIINKASKETIVSDAISYIKFLEEEKHILEDLKETMLQESVVAAKPCLSHFTSMNNNSSVNVTTSSNGVVFFGIELPSKTCLVSHIFRVFHKYQAEVLTASISVNEQQLLSLSATIMLGNNGGGDVIDKIKRDILVL